MNPELQKYFDTVLKEYSSKEHSERIVDAKRKYFKLTGTVYEEDEEYEARMNSFNDWYIFHYLSSEFPSTIINNYLKEHKLEPALVDAFKSINYSLFEVGGSFPNKILLKDWLHNNTYSLADRSNDIGCVAKDIFVGRVLEYQGKFYLLGGICILPPQAKSILKKYARKLSKHQDPNKEMNFLQRLEYLKIKWLRYRHVEVDKIFVFENI